MIIIYLLRCILGDAIVKKFTQAKVKKEDALLKKKKVQLVCCTVDSLILHYNHRLLDRVRWSSMELRFRMYIT